MSIVPPVKLHWLHDREGRLTVVPFCLREHIDDHLVRLPFGMIIVLDIAHRIALFLVYADEEVRHVALEIVGKA